ncbi:MAG: hypothetical protein VYE77_10675 [Planctomycetota bacterium]|nr:hypothetical protein [Planctomycetota bacterium]
MNCKLLSMLLVALPTLGVAQSKAEDLKGRGQDAATQTTGPAGTTAVRAGAKRQPQPNSWFSVTNQDLGTYFNNEEAKGIFKFKNPTDETLAWKHLAGSCQCSKAIITVGDRKYELSKEKGGNPLKRVEKGPKGDVRVPVSQIEIGPGEEGEVEVHMVMTGIQGPRQATLDIHTTDRELPQIRLKWQATGAKTFVLSPKEVNLNQMTWSETRDFTVTVTSPISPDFNITKMDEAAEGFDVKYEKKLENGRASWVISGTYSPTGSDTIGGGVLKFHTDVRGASFLLRVSAMVQGPLEVKPGSFLTLGMIRKGKTKAEKVTFQPNDDTDLAVTNITFERLTVDPKFITTRTSKEGKNLLVELEVSKDTPRGLLRGDMIVELNHPAVKSKKILFNGYVR